MFVHCAALHTPLFCDASLSRTPSSPPGNGQSDKPGLFTGHSRWWTIDDHVEKDVPALIRYVTKQTNTTQVRPINPPLLLMDVNASLGQPASVYLRAAPFSTSEWSLQFTFPLPPRG